MSKKAITSFDELIQSWTDRMMELDHKVKANRRSIEGLEKQIDETYKEMEDIQEAAYDLLGDKVQFNLYENEDNAIRISYKSSSMNEPLVNIVKDRKIQVGKKPNKSELYFFAEDGEILSDEKMASIIRMSEHEMRHKVIGKDGNYSSMEHGAIGTDEHGKPIQGIKMSVGNIASDIEPHTYHYRVRLPESSVEVSLDEIKIKGDTITFGKEVKLDRYEKEIENLKYQVKMLEEWHTPKQDPVPMDFDEENIEDKRPVLSEENDTQYMTMKEYNDLVELSNKLVALLNDEYLQKLHNNLLEGSFLYTMRDFHSLVAQLYMIQEAHKKKGDN